MSAFRNYTQLTDDEANSEVVVLAGQELSTLTELQEKILALVAFIPAILSIFGSSMIIYLVILAKKQSPYRRLLFAMSVCDIINSINLPLWSFLIPKDSSQRVWAVGTDVTCSVVGFFTQFAFSAFLYNAMLSYYFLLTVRYGMKENDVAKRAEPIMHFISLGFPLVTASYGAYLGVFHEMDLGTGCWVTNYPEGCEVEMAAGGPPCKSIFIGTVFGGLVILILIISLVINNTLIYRFVNNTIQRSIRRQSATTLSVASNHSARSGRSATTAASAMANENQQRRIQAVATQAFLYVFACLLSYTWSVTLRVMEAGWVTSEDEAALFPLLLLQQMFLPIQGFFNFLVFIRPKYMRTRNQFPYETKMWALNRAIHGEAVAPKWTTQDTRRASTKYSTGGTPQGRRRSSLFAKFSKLSYSRQSSFKTIGTMTNNVHFQQSQHHGDDHSLMSNSTTEGILRAIERRNQHPTKRPISHLERISSVSKSKLESSERFKDEELTSSTMEADNDDDCVRSSVSGLSEEKDCDNATNEYDDDDDDEFAIDTAPVALPPDCQLVMRDESFSSLAETENVNVDDNGDENNDNNNNNNDITDTSNNEHSNKSQRDESEKEGQQGNDLTGATTSMEIGEEDQVQEDDTLPDLPSQQVNSMNSEDDINSEITSEWLLQKQDSQKERRMEQMLCNFRKASDNLSEWSREFGVNDH